MYVILLSQAKALPFVFVLDFFFSLIVWFLMLRWLANHFFWMGIFETQYKPIPFVWTVKQNEIFDAKQQCVDCMYKSIDAK